MKQRLAFSNCYYIILLGWPKSLFRFFWNIIQKLKWTFWPIPNAAVLCLVAQLCLTLCDPVDSSPQAPLSMGILQARILEWVAMPSSRGSSQPSDQTQVSHTAGGFFIVWAPREAQEYWSG